MKPDGVRAQPVSPLRHMRMPLAFAFANAATWMVALSTPLVLLAGQLGASALQVGLLHSFVFLLLPVQVLATIGLSHLGFKRQMLLAWSLRSCFLLIPLMLALHAPQTPEPWMVHALIAAVFMFCFFRCLGSCAYSPWIYQLIPDSLRGRYFATEQFMTGFSGILTLLFCAALFHFLPPYQAFFWQYCLAFVASLLSVTFISKINTVPHPRSTQLRDIWLTTPGLVMQAGSFRRYLGFMISDALIITALSPFAAYYLKIEAGVSMEHIILYSAVLFTGLMTGAWFLRPHLDRIGVKPVFQLSLILKTVIFLFWIGYTAGFPGMKMLLPVAYFLFGVAMCLWTSTHLKYLPMVCPDNPVLAISVHTALVGMVAGVSPILWGWFLREPGAGINHLHFVVYLALGVLMLTFMFTRVRTLTAVNKDAPELQVGGFILRPLRYISYLLHLPPQEKDRRK